ncbi:hypothetical protein [Haloquadratum walsbyi]|jgi:hypothetical protein|uniref:Uncharacterized protein n=1 Tax=Haloquadratum walsbyi J07HQW2 TaxID=1238425 RepID=U1PW59_9EURY|nr:hypothetical protein [Haloquadratum walsbyi]ERG96666.1 MAG: hypothetical protein J07HQW2_03149 [Haloquadratum walsbyi J07HQW2]
MTTRPELKLGSHLLPGLAAIGLFIVMTVAFLSASFPQPQGFPANANITASIGYAMFNLDVGDVAGESFLAAFIVIALTLDVALDGSIHLARRERSEEDSSVLTDGGRKLKKQIFNEGDE